MWTDSVISTGDKNVCNLNVMLRGQNLKRTDNLNYEAILIVNFMTESCITYTLTCTFNSQFKGMIIILQPSSPIPVFVEVC